MVVRLNNSAHVSLGSCTSKFINLVKQKLVDYVWRIRNFELGFLSDFNRGLLLSLAHFNY
jgi:hypothetical protein